MEELKAAADTRVSFAETEGNSAAAHYFKRTFCDIY